VCVCVCLHRSLARRSLLAGLRLPCGPCGRPGLDLNRVFGDVGGQHARLQSCDSVALGSQGGPAPQAARVTSGPRGGPASAIQLDQRASIGALLFTSASQRARAPFVR